METVNPSALALDPIAKEGLLTTHLIARMLCCTQRTVLNWLEDGKLPAFVRDTPTRLHAPDPTSLTASSPSSYSSSIRSDAKMISCLQLYYFLKKSAFPTSDNILANAARFIFYYGWEPDQTLNLSYRHSPTFGDLDHPTNLAHLYTLCRELHFGFLSHADLTTAFLASKLTTEQRMNYLAIEGSISVKPVEVTTNGLITLLSLSKCLGCTRTNISYIIDSANTSATVPSQLPAFKLPGRGKQMYVTGLNFLYYLRRKKYVPHATVIQAATNSVMTYGWTHDPILRTFPVTHAELGILKNARPYPALVNPNDLKAPTPLAV